MPTGRALSRRIFLADLGRGTLALAVFGLAACAPSGSGTASSPAPSRSAAASASPGRSPVGSTAAPSASASAGVAWTRVDLGSVSAYVLVRSGEAAVVDTGLPGSEDAIGSALEGIGLGWGSVGHVVFTHLHPDHAGSSEAVLALATDATGYAGAEDIPGIAAPRPLRAVADGDAVFGLRIVATPGHTPGHVCVHDEVGGVLVAGDALGTAGGEVVGPNASFTEDMEEAMRSVVKLGRVTFETLLVGHGDPITAGASELVAALGAG